MVLNTDTFKNVITKYPYAKRVAKAFSESNATIINKLNGKNLKLYQNRYLIKGFNKTN